MRERQWAQVTVSKQYRSMRFVASSTNADGGWIKVRFDPGQRSFLLAPVSSANTTEKRPLLAQAAQAHAESENHVV